MTVPNFLRIASAVYGKIQSVVLELRSLRSIKNFGYVIFVAANCVITTSMLWKRLYDIITLLLSNGYQQNVSCSSVNNKINNNLSFFMTTILCLIMTQITLMEKKVLYVIRHFYLVLARQVITQHLCFKNMFNLNSTFNPILFNTAGN
jgi:hypothetical protein